MISELKHQIKYILFFFYFSFIFIYFFYKFILVICKNNFKIGNVIKNIDLFGSTINLTIKHKRTSQTKLGGCLTILAAIFFIIYGIINSKNLINRLNPVVTRFGVYDKQYIKVDDFFQKYQ